MDLFPSSCYQVGPETEPTQQKAEPETENKLNPEIIIQYGSAEPVLSIDESVMRANTLSLIKLVWIRDFVPETRSVLTFRILNSRIWG